MPVIEFKPWVINLVKAAGIAAVGILCLATLWMLAGLVASPTNHARLLSAIGLGAPEKRADPYQSWREIAASDHWAVAGWVLECTRQKEVPNLPGYFRPSFDRTHIDINSLPKPSPQEPKVASEPTPRLPNQIEIALLQLSNTIGDQRIALRSKIQTSYLSWQVATIATILLGLITTVLVSFSSTEFGKSEGLYPRLIRILAVIFPALGTAVAAVIAFYGPQAEWSQSTRSLASFTQLHAQMVIAMGKLKCSEVPPVEGTSRNFDAITHQFEEWSKRYVDILTVASVGGQANTNNGESPTSGNPTTK